MTPQEQTAMTTLTSARPGGPPVMGEVGRGAPTGAAAASAWLVHRLVSVALLSIVPVLVITVDVLADGPLRHLDGLLAGGTWHRDDTGLVQLGYVLDRLGQRAIAGTVLVVVAALLAGRRRSWRPLVVTGVALLALNIVVGAFKLGLGRTKPLSGVDLLYAGGSQFPSGHAANAVVSWGLVTYLVLAFGPVLAVPVVRALIALPVVVTVGMSMASLYLDYHWLTDLVAGAALGLALLALVLAWDLRRQPTEHAPRDDEPATTGAAGRVLAPTRPPV
jgi:membrane-associated phospholipid phosphatase